MRTTDRRLVHLGTQYGGWWVVDDSALYRSSAILGGAGEDISFDLALQARFGCECVIVDPTPRAVAHVGRVLAGDVGVGPVGGNGATESYDLTDVDLGQVRLLECALWDEPGEITFWAPADPRHVSFSATNLQSTNESITVPAQTLDQVIGFTASKSASLLKLDIEGAELRVLSALIKSSCRPSQILVEFDELMSPTPRRVSAVMRMVAELEALGYALVHFDGVSNCSFLLNDPNTA